MDSVNELSGILDAIHRGEADAVDKLLALVYDELHVLAASSMACEKPGTLQPTALVHEAYLRLFGQGTPRWENRRHFFAAAAEAMRRILVENARRKARVKRGGGLQRLELDDVVEDASGDPDEVLDLDQALDDLAREFPEKAELVKLRYFAGLSIEEAAQSMGVSRATANRHWDYAKAWLYERLRAGRSRGCESQGSPS
jgi:RNA polymerase sigma factor (TIGR02999 family)